MKLIRHLLSYLFSEFSSCSEDNYYNNNLEKKVFLVQKKNGFNLLNNIVVINYQYHKNMHQKIKSNNTCWKRLQIHNNHIVLSKTVKIHFPFVRISSIRTTISKKGQPFSDLYYQCRLNSYQKSLQKLIDTPRPILL